MEGVGARLGRSSTRYGPATVFTGPVRKWKKKWVHISPSTKKDNSSSASAATTSVVNGGSASDGSSNGSHLLLYKWAPLSQGSNEYSPSEEPVATAATLEDPPRRRFKYVPIAVLEEQKKEEITEIEEDDKVEEDEKAEEDDKVEEDGVKVDEDTSEAEPSEKKTEAEEKPDINDVPMEDNQEEVETVVRQDLNESTLDLGLNLNAKDADSEDNPKEDEPLEE
ncbi:hypothetical protein EUTSA_v10026905mg [Eutrema salsugineum]|uniref:Uncharacterized protein n=1 Tax=Eutrema salsugineum TaxID=72664 RepID=V4MIF4_EUTSA|nr:hypothetical protein EUTSA_v10026905mg [Eutrema salsugineum]